MLIRKTKTGQQLFLLLGEKVRMRASVTRKFYSPRPSISPHSQRAGCPPYRQWNMTGIGMIP